MKPSRKLIPVFLTLVLVLLLAPAPLFGEEEDAELALDPPDAPTTEAVDSELAAQLEESDQRDLAEQQETQKEAEVPNVDEDSFAARESNEQIKLLKYHRQMVVDRDRAKLSGQEDSPHTFHLAAGLLVNSEGGPGGDLDFQVSISDHFTLGGVLSTYRGTSTEFIVGEEFAGSYSVLGVAAVVNYYSRRPYEGIWLQFGAGMDSFRAGNNLFSDPTIVNTAPVFGTLGWRFLNDTNNLTFAFGVGGRFYPFAIEPSFVFMLNLQVGLAWNVFPH